MKKQTTIIILAVVALVVAFSTGLYFGQSLLQPYVASRENKAAALAAGEFVKDLTSDKLDAAYARTTPDMQKKQTEQAFVESMGNLKAEKPTYQQSSVLRKEDGTLIYTQNVTGLPKSSSGSDAGLFYVSMSKVKGAWKIDSVTVL